MDFKVIKRVVNIVVQEIKFTEKKMLMNCKGIIFILFSGIIQL